MPKVDWSVIQVFWITLQIILCSIDPCTEGVPQFPLYSYYEDIPRLHPSNNLDCRSRWTRYKSVNDKDVESKDTLFPSGELSIDQESSINIRPLLTLRRSSTKAINNSQSDYERFDGNGTKLKNYRQKFSLSITLKNNIGKVKLRDEFIVIDYVLDPVTSEKLQLLHPYILQIRQEPIVQLYRLRFRNVINAEVTEEIINYDHVNRTKCSDEIKNASFGFESVQQKEIPSHKAFCCPCNLEENKKSLSELNQSFTSSYSNFNTNQVDSANKTYNRLHLTTPYIVAPDTSQEFFQTEKNSIPSTIATTNVPTKKKIISNDEYLTTEKIISIEDYPASHHNLFKNLTCLEKKNILDETDTETTTDNLVSTTNQIEQLTEDSNFSRTTLKNDMQNISEQEFRLDRTPKEIYSIFNEENREISIFAWRMGKFEETTGFAASQNKTIKEQNRTDSPEFNATKFSNDTNESTVPFRSYDTRSTNLTLEEIPSDKSSSSLFLKDRRKDVLDGIRRIKRVDDKSRIYRRTKRPSNVEKDEHVEVFRDNRKEKKSTGIIDRNPPRPWSYRSDLKNHLFHLAKKEFPVTSANEITEDDVSQSNEHTTITDRTFRPIIPTLPYTEFTDNLISVDELNLDETTRKHKITTTKFCRHRSRQKRKRKARRNRKKIHKKSSNAYPTVLKPRFVSRNILSVDKFENDLSDSVKGDRGKINAITLSLDSVTVEFSRSISVPRDLYSGYRTNYTSDGIFFTGSTTGGTKLDILEVHSNFKRSESDIRERYNKIIKGAHKKAELMEFKKEHFLRERNRAHSLNKRKDVKCADNFSFAKNNIEHTKLLRNVRKERAIISSKENENVEDDEKIKKYKSKEKLANKNGDKTTRNINANGNDRNMKSKVNGSVLIIKKMIFVDRDFENENNDARMAEDVSHTIENELGIFANRHLEKSEDDSRGAYNSPTRTKEVGSNQQRYSPMYIVEYSFGNKSSEPSSSFIKTVEAVDLTALNQKLHFAEDLLDPDIKSTGQRRPQHESVEKIAESNSNDHFEKNSSTEINETNRRIYKANFEIRLKFLENISSEKESILFISIECDKLQNYFQIDFHLGENIFWYFIDNSNRLRSGIQDVPTSFINFGDAKRSTRRLSSIESPGHVVPTYERDHIESSDKRKVIEENDFLLEDQDTNSSGDFRNVDYRERSCDLRNREEMKHGSDHSSDKTTNDSFMKLHERNVLLFKNIMAIFTKIEGNDKDFQFNINESFKNSISRFGAEGVKNSRLKNTNVLACDKKYINVNNANINGFRSRICGSPQRSTASERFICRDYKGYGKIKGEMYAFMFRLRMPESIIYKNKYDSVEVDFNKRNINRIMHLELFNVRILKDNLKIAHKREKLMVNGSLNIEMNNSSDQNHNVLTHTNISMKNNAIISSIYLFEKVELIVNNQSTQVAFITNSLKRTCKNLDVNKLFSTMLLLNKNNNEKYKIRNSMNNGNLLCNQQCVDNEQIILKNLKNITILSKIVIVDNTNWKFNNENSSKTLSKISVTDESEEKGNSPTKYHSERREKLKETIMQRKISTYQPREMKMSGNTLKSNPVKDWRKNPEQRELHKRPAKVNEKGSQMAKKEKALQGNRQENSACLKRGLQKCQERYFAVLKGENINEKQRLLCKYSMAASDISFGQAEKYYEERDVREKRKKVGRKKSKNKEKTAWDAAYEKVGRASRRRLLAFPTDREVFSESRVHNDDINFATRDTSDRYGKRPPRGVDWISEIFLKNRNTRTSRKKRKRSTIENESQINLDNVEAINDRDCRNEQYSSSVDSSNKNIECARCYRFSDLWYLVYELEEPIIQHRIHFQLYQKRVLPDGSYYLNDLTEGSAVRLGTSGGHRKIRKGGTVTFTYNEVESKLGSRILDPARDRLLIPSLLTGPQLEGTSEYLVVDASEIGEDGKECDKAGVGFATFAKRPDRCERVTGTCLKNQPLSYWKHDMEARAAGRPGCYFLSNFVSAPREPIEYEVSGSGSRQFLVLDYDSPHVSAIDVEVKADYDVALRAGSSGCLTEVHVDNTKVEKILVTITIRNPEETSSSYQLHIANCPHDLPSSWRNLVVTIETIPPQKDYRIRFDLHGPLPLNELFCSVVLVDRHGESVATRDIEIRKMDRCHCVRHCLCWCVGGSSGQGCRPLSLEHYHAAGFRGPVPVLSSDAFVSSDFPRDVLLFTGVFAMLLLLMGFLKWILGIWFPVIRNWGLGMLDGKKENNEKNGGEYSKCECTNARKSDSKRENFRIRTRKMEFILNLILFLTYPTAACYHYTKKLFRTSSDRRFTSPESRVSEETVRLKSEPIGMHISMFDRASCTPEENELKLICVKTYADSRNTTMEAEDTEYVLNELKKSRISLQNRARCEVSMVCGNIKVRRFLLRGHRTRERSVYLFLFGGILEKAMLQQPCPSRREAFNFRPSYIIASINIWCVPVSYLGKAGVTERKFVNSYPASSYGAVLFQLACYYDVQF